MRATQADEFVVYAQELNVFGSLLIIVKSFIEKNVARWSTCKLDLNNVNAIFIHYAHFSEFFQLFSPTEWVV